VAYNTEQLGGDQPDFQIINKDEGMSIKLKSLNGIQMATINALIKPKKDATRAAAAAEAATCDSSSNFSCKCNICNSRRVNFR